MMRPDAAAHRAGQAAGSLAHEARAPRRRDGHADNDGHASHDGERVRASAGAGVEYQLLRLPPNGWVPNNRALPVIVYRRALLPDMADPASLADAFDARFAAHGWPPQWRDSVFDYHHFHSTAHEVLAVFAGRAELIVGGPGGHALRVSAGDALLLPAGTGHCLVSRAPGFQVTAGYPAGQQWDIRREALTPEEASAMEALPFPRSDPLCGDHGPLLDHWLAGGEARRRDP
ncbi:cupin domain-containing protein [Paraburkholderia caballeronis]|uniref:cupin domain-containing protein n=1 Tax=Paraburkholderia caballeronis TaxID=416943 RepID=UPI001FB9CE01|nr:cupin domain-containing protein [Paraburkholderia caballeronis]